MSATAQQPVVVLAGGRRARADREVAGERARLAVRVSTFAALGLYGTLRWATMLSPAPEWRLLGLLAVAIAVVAIGTVLGPRSRPALTVVAVLAVIAALPLSGIPLEWVRHVRIALTANGIGEGLSALPRALVPYLGVNEWLRTVIVLGAAVLLLDGALMLAFAPRRLTDVRRAAAALPLVALAVVPSTLNRPLLAYVHGLVLFVLLAAFMWGERLRRSETATTLSIVVLGAAAAMVLAPAIDRHTPWLNYQQLASNLAPAHPESFDWAQSYGPLHWPQKGHEVFEVQAQRKDYWKTENLDQFNGVGWAASEYSSPAPQATATPGALAQWSETLHVTIHAMKTTDVIAAGAAQLPQHISGVIAGETDGTWTAPGGLGPGDSYTVTVYAPHPSATQLRAAGTDYGALPPPYLSIQLPAASGAKTSGRHVSAPAIVVHGHVVHRPSAQGASGTAFAPASLQPVVYFAPFGFHAAPVTSGTVDVESSPYAPAYALAQRLQRGAATPYDFVTAVMHYLDHSGYRYDQDTPLTRYPLETFLFKTRRGYCQQFAGAMALLLRMGGVPARVATGFASGSYDSATKSYVVSDTDAHAWVEVWFPGYGWVRFDPTPAQDPALGGKVPNEPLSGAPSAPSKTAPGKPGRAVTPRTNGITGPVHTPGSGGTPVALWIALGLLVGLAVLALAFTVRLHEPSDEELLSELERALARSGRPLAAGTTLVALEHRFRRSPEAQAYVRTLRMARFAGGRAKPSAAQRRAVRNQLRAGLGIPGLVRAVWALPPRILVRTDKPKAPAQGLDSG